MINIDHILSYLTIFFSFQGFVMTFSFIVSFLKNRTFQANKDMANRIMKAADPTAASVRRSMFANWKFLVFSVIGWGGRGVVVV